MHRTAQHDTILNFDLGLRPTRSYPSFLRPATLSGSHHLDQNFLFRPAFGWSRYKTPVRNLYLCGASTWPGAGVNAGSGFMLAKMLAGNPR
jgi:hypothetical protein